MTERRNVSTGSPYEPIVGLSRIMQVTRFIDRQWLIETEVDAVA